MAQTYIKNHTNTFLIHGHSYTVTMPARFDTTTHQLVDDKTLDDAAVEQANQLYRHDFNLITPAELKQYRQKTGLTQRQLAEVLDWSPNTIALYETGALPTKSNSKILRALMVDDHFLEILMAQDAPKVSAKTRQKIQTYLNLPADHQAASEATPKYTALQLANWYRVQNYFDAELDPNVEELSQMKVVKLLYFAFGRYLARTHEKLFDSPIIAMPYGPVVETVHQHFNGKKGIVENQLNDTAFNDYNNIQADSTIANLLADVQADFGSWTATALSRITHQQNSPWSATQPNQAINPQLIQQSFTQGLEQ